ncbi:Rad3-related DNA helicase [Thermosporothrix hazakensis]|uniref:Rad3-related DNA helicase n=2 Tax=Thermosporothrix TaxID=768650 RepID=A0A326U5Z6_THEHA|nr:helicase C-terminal domain-containing protein [Thermosporothrix hazakensis]PZW25442.1 Rad3-related DNA helicase [Thermosporothrix hazakensis]BBH90778.1 hypothetical protein KTC_55290 [Thermosporothrix sp. COM3]GCE48828.1 hypothetical protein KTH_36970 [Thermosporothrix hazakensis]
MTEVELRQIGSYTISALLRTDTAYTYYRGQHRKKEILLKCYHQPLTTDEAKTAFLTYAKKLHKLKDRGIASLQAEAFEGDRPYLVFEYYDPDSAWIFQPGQLHTAAEVKQILTPIAQSLNYAHTRNIIHGNLHPRVFIKTPAGPLLTGFTIPIPGVSLDDLTAAIPYMAPEQLRGEPEAASDQYALAAIVYEWLCGRRPYEASEREELQRQQVENEIPHPTSLNPALSQDVATVLLKALARDPQDRFPDTYAFSNNYLHALMHLPLDLNKPVRRIRAIVSQEPASPPPATPRLPEPILPVEPKSEPETIKPPDSQPTYQSEKPEEVQRSLEPEAPKEAEPEPIPETTLQRIVSADLRQGGSLSRSLPGYEERPAQLEMASLVARSLSHHVPAIIEAGTGTGKSLAYLIPVVRSGKVAIVSTANKALQEQLYYKDIPFVQKHIKPFEAALVKGVNNYICLDRLDQERFGMQVYTKHQEFQRLLDVINDPESSFTGDFETLGFQLPADVRGRIATDRDQCAWTKCNYFGDCYIRQMRERAERSQVIIVNHTLLLLDTLMDGFLLPERDVIIVDEAHHLEEEATRSFTVTIGPNQIQTLLAQRMLKDHSQQSLQAEVFNAAQKMWIRLEQIMETGYKGRVNLEEQLEEGLYLASALEDLGSSLRRQRPKDLPEKDAQLYDKLLKRTQNLAENVRLVFSVADTSRYVYYIERVEGSGPRQNRANTQLQVSASPLDITRWLKEKLFNKCNVICTSATLATVSSGGNRPEDRRPNFQYFRRRIGLEPEERPDVLESILPLTFDYEQNALLYVPRDLPAPAYGAGSDEYMKAIAREMYRLVKLSRGRAFLLFSSKRMLDRAYELMAPHLSYPLLKQGDMTRLELTRRFRQEEGAVLFGLKSFWEGVDIAGDALSLVVIDKLPFDPPDDPVHEARVAHMKANGENWFGDYVLPQAVLRLKQGIGRLLRTRTDRGVMAILDTRLHTKGYGRLVLNALPPARKTINVRDVERFFREMDKAHS